MKKGFIAQYLDDLKSLLYFEIIKRREVHPFIIFVSFIASFVAARLIVTFLPDAGIVIEGYRVHHVFYGIGLLVVSNWIVLASNRPNLMKTAAIIFGIGLGLITDEIGLLLTCSSNGKICDYYARQSYDALIIVSLIFFIIIYFPPLWENIRKRLKS